MSTLKCQMCGEECDNMQSIIVHMSKSHMMNFNDQEDMNRRLTAIGFDPVVDTKHTEPIFVNPTKKILHG